MKQINAVKGIILKGSEDETTLKSKYQGVQALYKVGCGGCDSLQFTRSLCEDCKTKAREIDTSDIEDQIKRLMA